MLFYCPNCQEEYEAEPNSTVTTKSNRIAYKTFCPVCNLELVEFIAPSAAPTDSAGPATPPTASSADLA